MDLGELTAGEAAVQEGVDLLAAGGDRPPAPILASKGRGLGLELFLPEEGLQDGLSFGGRGECGGHFYSLFLRL